MPSYLIEEKSRNGIIYGSTWTDPPTDSYLFAFDSRERAFRVITKVKREARHLVLDKRKYLYWISRNSIFRISIEERG